LIIVHLSLLQPSRLLVEPVLQLSDVSLRLGRLCLKQLTQILQLQLQAVLVHLLHVHVQQPRVLRVLPIQVRQLLPHLRFALRHCMHPLERQAHSRASFFDSGRLTESLSIQNQ
jgi:hypothetical protein